MVTAPVHHFADQRVHIQQINRLFQMNRITGGFVVRDARGRVLLEGEYLEERQVDQGFSLAQTVVGVRWVSPVTPHKIKVKQWESCLSRLFSGEKWPAVVRRAEEAARGIPLAAGAGSRGERLARRAAAGRRPEICPRGRRKVQEPTVSL